MRRIMYTVLAVVCFQFFIPFIGGVYYACCGDRFYEQVWLDRVILHLKVERATCRDPEIREVLDYTIQRYNRIGAWDVMIMPLACLSFEGKVIGCNIPYCPGLTLDPEVMHYGIHTGAMVLVHESMHDGLFNCHPFIDAKMKRVGCL